MADKSRLRVNAGDLLPGDRLVSRWQDGKWVVDRGKESSVVAEVKPLNERLLVVLDSGEQFNCPPTLMFKVDRET